MNQIYLRATLPFQSKKLTSLFSAFTCKNKVRVHISIHTEVEDVNCCCSSLYPAWFIPLISAQGLQGSKEYAGLVAFLRHCGVGNGPYETWLPGASGLGAVRPAHPQCQVFRSSHQKLFLPGKLHAVHSSYPGETQGKTPGQRINMLANQFKVHFRQSTPENLKTRKHTIFITHEQNTANMHLVKRVSSQRSGVRWLQVSSWLKSRVRGGLNKLESKRNQHVDFQVSTVDKKSL